MAGVIVTNGAVTTAGMRPSVTIGSENTIRISLACSREASTPEGPELTTVSDGGVCASAATTLSHTPANARHSHPTRLIGTLWTPDLFRLDRGLAALDTAGGKPAWCPG
jgi:hypothetical protein